MDNLKFSDAPAARTSFRRIQSSQLRVSPRGPSAALINKVLPQHPETPLSHRTCFHFMADVNEKLLDLANSFKRFNFPNGAVETGDSRQKAYFTAVSTLYCLNTKRLDSIVDDYLEQYQLALNFELNEGTGNEGQYLSEFTVMLQTAIDEENDLIAADFAASQIDFSQSDSDFEGNVT